MRIIKHERNHPYAVKLGDLPQFKDSDETTKKTELHICACGLSKHKPFCDGSHRHVQQEAQGKIYVYNAEGKGNEISDSTAFEQIESAPNEYE
ncbi:MAG: CDGSH iron-sulfur domain-containing protein [Candidatus Micrarchaeia archaeon]